MSWFSLGHIDRIEYISVGAAFLSVVALAFLGVWLWFFDHNNDGSWSYSLLPKQIWPKGLKHLILSSTLDLLALSISFSLFLCVGPGGVVFFLAGILTSWCFATTHYPYRTNYNPESDCDLEEREIDVLSFRIRVIIRLIVFACLGYIAFQFFIDTPIY